jgi:hypothetical protein
MIQLVLSLLAIFSISIHIAAVALLVEEDRSYIATNRFGIYIADSNYLFYAILATFSFISSIVYIILRAKNSDFGLTAGQKDVTSLVVSIGSTMGWLAIACIFVPTVILYGELTDGRDKGSFALSRTNRTRTLADVAYGSVIVAVVLAWLLFLMFAMSSHFLVKTRMNASKTESEVEKAEEPVVEMEEAV